MSVEERIEMFLNDNIQTIRIGMTIYLLVYTMHNMLYILVIYSCV